MKRLFLLISAIYVGISFMGCSRESSTQISIEKPNIVNVKTENTEEFDITDWETTPYETIGICQHSCRNFYF